MSEITADLVRWVPLSEAARCLGGRRSDTVARIRAAGIVDDRGRVCLADLYRVFSRGPSPEPAPPPSSRAPVGGTVAAEATPDDDDPLADSPARPRSGRPVPGPRRSGSTH